MSNVDKIQDKELRALSVEKRVHFANVLFESLVAEPEAFILTDAQREELEREIEAHRKNPAELVSWEEFRPLLRTAS